jgi:hypothetical protein
MGGQEFGAKHMTWKPRSTTALAFILAMSGPMPPDSGAAAEQTLPQDYGNGLPAESSFFPIGVWLQSPSHAAEFRAIGINLFIGLYDGPTEQQLADLAKLKMPVIAEQNDVALMSVNSDIIRGWLVADEPDNAQPAPGGSWGPCIAAKDVAKRSAEIKARDPTRPVLVNFGRGVADPKWIGRGSCTGDLGYYNVAAAQADILSFDIYPVASGLAGGLDYPSRGVSSLRALSRDNQRVWVAIETTRVESTVARVSPAQLRSEVWLALIRGANGLVYFVHEWTGGFREDGVFRYPEIVEAVRDINRSVMKFAPVLNSTTIEGQADVAAPITLATMLKQYQGTLYLFVGSTEAESGPAVISLRDFADGRAEVIGEDRTLRISKGKFADRFDGSYEIHIYRITGGH